MKIIVIHKEPMIERIPNLKAFLVFASSNNHEITLLTTKNKTYPEPSFLTRNIKYLAVEERSRKFQLPTFFRFYALCLFILMGKIFQNYSLILAGKYALIFGSIINFIRLKKFSSFIIEYPELQVENRKKLSLADKLELNGVRKSEFLVTHDRLHAEFIAEKMNISNIKFVTIPNGTIGLAKKIESKFLHDRLNINRERKILLHSGGFGAWFDSSQLSKESEKISKDYDLLFHVSHDISKDIYYAEYLKNKQMGDRSLFSMEPVSTDKLDELISSSYIGIAWYSTDVLGYRATMLGLAAGKIGNYLKCGIPVIVPAFNSFNYISDFSCGKQIFDLDGLNDAISEINNNYSLFSKNALRCYDELWNTEKYCENLLVQII